jgi:hypothetical protein
MGIDIKLPIGIMFSVFGILLTIYGLFTISDVAMYQKSFGININLYSGLFMLLFGSAMLVASKMSRKQADKNKK